MASVSGLLIQQVVGARFSFYSDAEIRRLSVKQIVNPQTFDQYGHATVGLVAPRVPRPSLLCT